MRDRKTQGEGGRARGSLRRAAAIACSTIALSGFALAPAIAQAATADELASEAASLNQQLQQATQDYESAQAEVDGIQAYIDQNESDIAALEAELPEKRAKAAESIRTLYKFQQDTPGLIELVLSSEDFNDFISTVNYIDAIHQRSTEQVTELADLADELAQKRAELTSQKDEAVQRQQAAEQALSSVRTAQASVQAQADELARQEEAERQAAVDEAQQAVDAASAAAGSDDASSPDAAPEATFTTSSGNTATVEVPSSPSTDNSAVSENTTSSEQDGWAARIDAYLAGSPLAGQGATFAAAAARYGVDPRISPAISTVESSKGAVCFRPHNAWGWGSSSWSSWEEAIYAHVSGFASGYGSTMSMAVAQKYCPPTASQWYASVVAEMNKI